MVLLYRIVLLVSTLQSSCMHDSHKQSSCVGMLRSIYRSFPLPFQAHPPESIQMPYDESLIDVIEQMVHNYDQQIVHVHRSHPIYTYSLRYYKLPLYLRDHYLLDHKDHHSYS